MNKHTPGPWRYVPYFEDEEDIVDTDGDVNCHDGEGDPVAQSASYHDGILIAAAPALLEACKRLVSGQVPSADDVALLIAMSSGSDEAHRNALSLADGLRLAHEAARAAIALAEGGAK